MEINAEDYIEHYGTPRHSGRYPWGTSGWGADAGDGTQRNVSFLGFVKDMRAEGMSDTEIATAMGMTTTEFRRRRTLERATLKQDQIHQAKKLRQKGMSHDEIADRMGLAGESSVRALLKESTQHKLDAFNSTRDMLRAAVDEKGYVDVGAGVENELGISGEKKRAAIQALKDEGYVIHYGKVRQLGTNEDTSLMVLGPKGSSYNDYLENVDNIQTIRSYTEDGGETWVPILPPKSISSKRVDVVYAEDGGANADGVIYVRPGVDELSLGKGNYAQVRIAVDGSHYLKGMAVYKTDLPDGVDLQFHTNKSKDVGDKLAVMKKLEAEEADGLPALSPFGSIVRQQHVTTDKDGNRKVNNVMNIVNDEEDWEKWSRNLSSQVLSKQKPSVARDQLNEAYLAKRDELDEIKALSNPTVRRRLLESYSDGADASAVSMKAAAMPRQRTQVLLPVNSLKDNEIFAPNFRDGESVVLIRYPHGGTFEIPELKVNNKNQDARKIIGSDAPNAVGINAEVAKRLSGADFDGDTVLVIPNAKKRISTSPALEGLKDFDPQDLYKMKPGEPKISEQHKQTQMGVVSNLITDMTIAGAPPDELAKAVRHSMVVIDAEKHHLDYKKSAQDNNITHLRKKYQGDPDDPNSLGAATIVSRAKSRVDVPDRRPARVSEGGPVDPKTGELRYVPTGKIGRDGTPLTTRSKRMVETSDARTLIGPNDTVIERVYADHANRMKGLANEARREALKTPPLKYSPAAKAAYADEVTSLDRKLNAASRNAPRERQAQIAGRAEFKARKQANPDMSKAEQKKIKGLLLEKHRRRVGASKPKIDITSSEWEAIQAGAISDSKLKSILRNADDELIKKYATPKRKTLMTSAKTARAQAMMRNGYTQQQVADALGVSLTTLKNTINA